MTIRVEQAAIIGVGLLGASLGLALKQRGLAGHIVGVGRSHESLGTALKRGAIDDAALNVSEGVSEADLICIATPAGAVTATLDAVIAASPAHAVVFDVASTKKNICDHARTHCPLPRRFAGCHPMAGSEKSGPAHAFPNLYAGATCLVERDDTIAPDARDQVCALWRAVGSRVVDIDPAGHDVLLAATSHAPHVAAAILARIASDSGATGDFIGNGFRDVTRVAASRAELWRDICMENREALCYSLGEMRRQIALVESLLTSGNTVALEEFFEAAADARRRITEL
jgi:prephenate dehydrogenase